jgi:hypothetical protein
MHALASLQQLLLWIRWMSFKWWWIN